MEYQAAINRYVRKGDWFLWVNMHKASVSLPIFQSLEAFYPGLLTMIGEVEDAARIMLQYSQVVRQYGFPPEFYNIQNSVSEKRTAFPLRPEVAESLMYLYRATQDPHYLELGAQLVDVSLLTSTTRIFYRGGGAEIEGETGKCSAEGFHHLSNTGAQSFHFRTLEEAIEHSAKTPCGYATINNVNDHSIEDRMESFFLAETTKYLYLLFDPNNFLHNDGIDARIVDTPNGECVIDGGSQTLFKMIVLAGGFIFNTEAHPIDPGIVHCCSAQRQAEREAVQNWEDQFDLLSILDHRETVESHDSRKETLPEFLAGLKEIREDPAFFENLKKRKEVPGSEDIEYEIDESFLENKTSPDDLHADKKVVDTVEQDKEVVEKHKAEETDASSEAKDKEGSPEGEEKVSDTEKIAPEADEKKVERRTGAEQEIPRTQEETPKAEVKISEAPGAEQVEEVHTPTRVEGEPEAGADLASKSDRGEDQKESNDTAITGSGTESTQKEEQEAQIPGPLIVSEPRKTSGSPKPPLPPFLASIGATRAWKLKMNQKDILKK
ncbi:unnamed protein product, partial [Cylicostephanus goldi]